MSRVFTDNGAMKLISGTQRQASTDSFSVAFWLFRTATPAADRCLISAVDPVIATVGWVVRLTAANLIAAVQAFSTANKVRNSTTAPALNTWVHVIVTCAFTGTANTDFTFYFNGKSEAGTSITVGSGTHNDATAVPVEIGSSAGDATTAAPAHIGPVALWSRALSPAEALALATGANPIRFRQGLVDIFNMETAHGELGRVTGLWLAQGATNPITGQVNPPMEPIPTYLSVERQNYRTRRARYHVPATGFVPKQRRTRHIFGTHVGGRTQVNA